MTYDSTYQDRVYTVNLVDVTLEQALQQIVAANPLFYKVMNPKTIMIIPDNAQKRAQYEEQVIVRLPVVVRGLAGACTDDQPGHSSGGGRRSRRR